MFTFKAGWKRKIKFIAKADTWLFNFGWALCDTKLKIGSLGIELFLFYFLSFIYLNPEVVWHFQILCLELKHGCF